MELKRIISSTIFASLLLSISPVHAGAKDWFKKWVKNHVVKPVVHDTVKEARSKSKEEIDSFLQKTGEEISKSGDAEKLLIAAGLGIAAFFLLVKAASGNILSNIIATLNLFGLDEDYLKEKQKEGDESMRKNKHFGKIYAAAVDDQEEIGPEELSARLKKTQEELKKAEEERDAFIQRTKDLKKEAKKQARSEETASNQPASSASSTESTQPKQSASNQQAPSSTQYAYTFSKQSAEQCAGEGSSDRTSSAAAQQRSEERISQEEQLKKIREEHAKMFNRRAQ